jgi:hypothetical protein
LCFNDDINRNILNPSASKTQIPLGPHGVICIGRYMSFRARGQNSAVKTTKNSLEKDFLIIYTGDDDDHEYFSYISMSRIMK